MKIEEKIKGLIEKPINDAGFLVDQVIYEENGKSGVLTIVIDKAGIIDIDDCVKVTKIVNPILDREDPIEQSYVLDICSKEKGSE